MQEVTPPGCGNCKIGSGEGSATLSMTSELHSPLKACCIVGCKHSKAEEAHTSQWLAEETFAAYSVAPECKSTCLAVESRSCDAAAEEDDLYR